MNAEIQFLDSMNLMALNTPMNIGEINEQSQLWVILEQHVNSMNYS